MKKAIVLISLCFLSIFIACKKNDDNSPIEIALENEPPLSFDLIDVPNGAEDIDITPTLSWESAKNLKGSEVTYDLYLDTALNPTTLFESGIEDTSFEIPERLQLLTDYHWKVVATDDNGRSSQSAIHKFTTRYYILSNAPIVAETEFSARLGHTSVIFDNKIWVIGGNAGGGEFKGDVWNSSDGKNWNQVLELAPFGQRFDHSSVVFDNKIWVIGGASPGFKNDAWYSEDGLNWIEAANAIPFNTNSNHASVVFDNKIWVIGGGNKNHVWYTSNGVHWTEVQAPAFSARNGLISVVFDEKIWIIGGASGFDYFDDIWSSSDGINWSPVTIAPSFSARSEHTSLVHDDKIWVIGGSSGGGNGLNDAWYSTNGIDWIKTTQSSEFSGRFGHSSVVFDNKLWIISGFHNHRINDIWVLD